MTEHRSAGYLGSASDNETAALNAILNDSRNGIGRVIQPPYPLLATKGYNKPEQVRALLDRLVEQGNAQEYANGKYKRVA